MEARYEGEFLRELFRAQKYEVIYSQNPDFIIYSAFGERHLDYDCARIFYTGENIRADFNIADYSIDFDFMDFGERHLRFPQCFFDAPNPARSDNTGEKFCAFMITHSSPFTFMRDSFFEKLSQYKRVDSGGQCKNNIGGAIGVRYDHATIFNREAF